MLRKRQAAINENGGAVTEERIFTAGMEICAAES
jgi:hypothetical protein